MRRRHISYGEIDRELAKISEEVKTQRRKESDPTNRKSIYFRCSSWLLLERLGIGPPHCQNMVRSKNILCTICAKHSFLYKVANSQSSTKCLLCPENAVYESACERHSCQSCKVIPTSIVINLAKICLRRKSARDQRGQPGQQDAKSEMSMKTMIPKDLWRLLFMELRPTAMVCYHVKNRDGKHWPDKWVRVKMLGHEHHPIRRNYKDDLVKVHLVDELSSDGLPNECLNSV